MGELVHTRPELGKFFDVRLKERASGAAVLNLGRVDTSETSLDSGLQLNLYTGHAHAKYALESTFSHNDAYLASGSEDGNAKVWRLVEASVAADLKGAHATAATSLAWHPSRASVLLAAFDGTVSLWEPPAGPS